LSSQVSESAGTRNQESEIRNQESGIRNQESGIRNQESGIRNQESGMSLLEWNTDCSPVPVAQFVLHQVVDEGLGVLRVLSHIHTRPERDIDCT